MAKKKKKTKRAASKSKSGCRVVTFRKNRKGRRITPVTVTLCNRDAKARRAAAGRRNAKQQCRRADKGDRNPSTKHLFTSCDAR